MKHLILLAPVIASMAGCAGGTAECNDSLSKETAISIIESHVQKAVWAKEMYDKGYVTDVSLANIKTTSYDEKLDFYQCEGDFIFNYKEKEKSIPIQYELSYLEDSGDTEVSVYGVDDVKSTMMSFAFYGK